MSKNEADFLKRLEQKAEEQRGLMGTEILPDWAKGVGDWLVVNPWRVIVPISGLSYILLRMTGPWVREAVLAIFGGFRL